MIPKIPKNLVSKLPNLDEEAFDDLLNMADVTALSFWFTHAQGDPVLLSVFLVWVMSLRHNYCPLARSKKRVTKEVSIFNKIYSPLMLSIM